MRERKKKFFFFSFHKEARNNNASFGQDILYFTKKSCQVCLPLCPSGGLSLSNEFHHTHLCPVLFCLLVSPVSSGALGIQKLLLTLSLLPCFCEFSLMSNTRSVSPCSLSVPDSSDGPLELSDAPKIEKGATATASVQYHVTTNYIFREYSLCVAPCKFGSIIMHRLKILPCTRCTETHILNGTIYVTHLR